MAGEIRSHIGISPIDGDGARQQGVKDLFCGVAEGTFVLKGDIEFVLMEKFDFIVHFVARVVHPSAGGVHFLVFAQGVKEFVSFLRFAIAKNKTAKAFPWFGEGGLFDPIQQDVQHGFGALWKAQASGLIPGVVDVNRKPKIAGIVGWVEADGVVASGEIGLDIFARIKDFPTGVFFVAVPEHGIDENVWPELCQLVADSAEVKSVGEKVIFWIEISPEVVKPQTYHVNC
jgi:hypothetical protein